MNKQLLLLALLGTALIGSTVFLLVKSNNNVQENEENLAQLWSLWKKTYNKKYADPDSEHYRIQVFSSNLDFVKQDTTGTMGITQFFDLTRDEFAATYLTERLTDNNEPIAEDIPIDSSTNINWVTEEKVTDVKNQGSCGSCWTFSATGAVESALIIAGKAERSINLSEQQLVDCCTAEYDNAGCNGGNKDQAFRYIESNPITTEANYPYKAVNQKCNTQKAALTPNYTISNYKQVNASTNDLAEALKIQPIAISVDASNWSFYTGGIFSNCNNTTHNHAVLLVGFQNDAWIVKNSWGTTWGENGYIRLKNGNTCGLANVPYYPIA
ncbi:papain family cysteine protease (macronuclear) [Tetrahymena thermophila SB210]|uniref:Papain family cysteine protease n=1 Tax=Tetrahymena thermophila (strain SB210) TaxID=312017 RepID=I7MCJ5_TETTS|nr:papain family cysteine protease [Tetrahymena thermophila SB210]EAR84061.1 papain family cysteine protease [Tetrahymena thermophila SB210]|eukprot:XP_001031724.1 papain family cysteine protease [Tetrahymena thermophila SB210]